MCMYFMFLWFGYVVAWVSDQESIPLLCVISVFVISCLSSPFSCLPLPPTIFDHYGMKNATGPYANSWNYQCKFLTFFRGGEFLACTISFFHNAADCLMVYVVWHCLPKKKREMHETVLADTMLLFQQFNAETFNIKTITLQNLLWKQIIWKAWRLGHGSCHAKAL